jgi:hypothetical protein
LLTNPSTTKLESCAGKSSHRSNQSTYGYMLKALETAACARTKCSFRPNRRRRQPNANAAVLRKQATATDPDAAQNLRAEKQGFEKVFPIIRDLGHPQLITITGTRENSCARNATLRRPFLRGYVEGLAFCTIAKGSTMKTIPKTRASAIRKYSSSFNDEMAPDLPRACSTRRNLGCAQPRTMQAQAACSLNSMSKEFS